MLDLAQMRKEFSKTETSDPKNLFICEEKMSRIADIKARPVLDSRGNPTVEAEITLDYGTVERAIVPSGASTGQFEALELRDKDESRFLGKGVDAAVKHVNEVIKPQLIGHDVTEQQNLDSLMLEIDGTANKGKLGANAILAVSLAAAKTAASFLDIPLYKYVGGHFSNLLPTPMMNVINGGEHADNNLDIQEFMIVPAGFSTFSEGLRAGVEIYHHLKKELTKAGLSTGIGDEGGYAPNFKSNKEGLDFLCSAVERSGYKLGEEIGFALDVAATEFYNRETGLYHIDGKDINSAELTDYYKGLIDQYPILSIEDGMDEEDWEGWRTLTLVCGDNCQLVGDDLFVTQLERLERGYEHDVANAILIKPNQVGSLSETVETVRSAQFNSYNTVMSHRSGESEDSTIADLAVGLSCGQIKTGAPCRSDRNAKYNQLLRIEEMLGGNADYAGFSYLLK